MVGTTIAWVTASSRAVATHSAAEKAGRYTSRRPEYTAERIAETPATWYGGTLTRVASDSSEEPNSLVLRM